MENNDIKKENSRKRAFDSIVLSISSNQMEAGLVIHPDDAGESNVTEGDVIEAITRDGRIVYGLDEEAIRKAVYAEGVIYGDRVCIARGRAPVRGDDAVLDILFKTSHDMKPAILEDGTVDYKSLNLFEEVSAGQLLVRKTPATSGVPGMTVTGKPVAPKPGRDKVMPRGKNVEISADGLRMTSTADGRVDIKDGKVIVSTCFEISQDADMSIGNTDFNGDIVIKGGVISGLSIKGSGNVEIFGIVEGANIEAGRDIILRQGMQGADTGTLKAGGRVYSRFIERATVNAVGDVIADTLVHSNVNSEGDVKVLGKRGVIIGGVTRASGRIIARSVGSTSCTPTLFEIGMSPEQRMRIIELEQLKEKLSSVNRRLENRVQSFGAVPIPGEPERTRALRVEAIKEKMLNQKRLSAVKDELAHLQATVENAQSGRLHVLKVAFPGVQISISPLRFLVTNEVEYATFKMGENEIVFEVCEYREGS